MTKCFHVTVLKICVALFEVYLYTVFAVETTGKGFSSTDYGSLIRIRRRILPNRNLKGKRNFTKGNNSKCTCTNWRYSHWWKWKFDDIFEDRTKGIRIIIRMRTWRWWNRTTVRNYLKAKFYEACDGNVLYLILIVSYNVKVSVTYNMHEGIQLSILTVNIVY